MRLADILALDRVTVQLVAADKASALRGLAQLLVDAPDGPEAEAIAQVFEQREALASTGVGSGVAIPHGRMHGVDSLRAAVGISADGVDFEAIDGRPARIFVAVLGPIAKTGEHLKALARFSRVLRREAVREQLLTAATDSAALEIVLGADG